MSYGRFPVHGHKASPSKVCASVGEEQKPHHKATLAVLTEDLSVTGQHASNWTAFQSLDRTEHELEQVTGWLTDEGQCDPPAVHLQQQQHLRRWHQRQPLVPVGGSSW